MANSKVIILRAPNGDPITKELTLINGPEGKFNYLIQKLSAAAATASVKVYESPDSNPDLTTAIQLGQTLALGDTLQLTKGLNADVSKYNNRITVWLDPSAAGEWQVTLVAV